MTLLPTRATLISIALLSTLSWSSSASAELKHTNAEPTAARIGELALQLLPIATLQPGMMGILLSKRIIEASQQAEARVEQIDGSMTPFDPSILAANQARPAKDVHEAAHASTQPKASNFKGDADQLFRLRDILLPWWSRYVPTPLPNWDDEPAMKRAE